jgi:hypothetical protein
VKTKTYRTVVECETWSVTPREEQTQDAGEEQTDENNWIYEGESQGDGKNYVMRSFMISIPHHAIKSKTMGLTGASCTDGYTVSSLQHTVHIVTTVLNG